MTLADWTERDIHLWDLAPGRSRVLTRLVSATAPGRRPGIADGRSCWPVRAEGLLIERDPSDDPLDYGGAFSSLGLSRDGSNVAIDSGRPGDAVGAHPLL